MSHHVLVNKTQSFGDVKSMLALRLGVEVNALVGVEMWKQRIYKTLGDDLPVLKIMPKDEV